MGMKFIALRLDEVTGEMKAAAAGGEEKQRLNPEPCHVTINQVSGEELE